MCVTGPRSEVRGARYEVRGTAEEVRDPYDEFRRELIEAGLLVPMGVPGVYGRGEQFERVVDGFDRLVSGEGRKLAPEVMRFPAGVGRDQQCAIGTDRNFAAMRQKDVGVHVRRLEIDRDLTGRQAEPEQDRFESKGRNHFATIAKEQRHMNPIGDFIGQIDEPGRRDEPHLFTRLAANAGKTRPTCALVCAGSVCRVSERGSPPQIT